LLPQIAYDYYASGANDEITLRENRAGANRMLVDVSVRDMSTTVLGEPVSMPVLIAPTALQGLAHPEGEIAMTKAASAAKPLQLWRPFRPLRGSHSGGHRARLVPALRV
jgi:isopentenyl diphosphate isomerase/L-lactate dehydrogenase-like FMN-dependent dehydrogenase